MAENVFTLAGETSQSLGSPLRPGYDDLPRLFVNVGPGFLSVLPNAPDFLRHIGRFPAKEAPEDAPEGAKRIPSEQRLRLAHRARCASGDGLDLASRSPFAGKNIASRPAECSPQRRADRIGQGGNQVVAET